MTTFPRISDFIEPPRTEGQKRMDEALQRAIDTRIAYFQKHAVSALTKVDPDHLTNDERAAICYYAGVKSATDIRTNVTTYEPHAMAKVDGKWIVAVRAKPFCE